MKRKILSVLGVLMAVILSTALLTGCNKTPAGADSSGGSGESVSAEQGGEPSVSESAAESSGESESSAEKVSAEQIGTIAMEKWKNICAALFEDVNTLTKERLVSIYSTYYIQTADKLDAYQCFPKSDVAAFAEDYFGIDIYNAETAAALGIGDDEEFSADTHADVIFYGDYALLDCAENSDGTYTMVVQTIIDLEGLFPPGEDKITRISTVKFSYDNKNVHFISAEYTQDGEKIP